MNFREWIDENGVCAIPDNITSIGDWAFEGCTGLTGVKLPPSITSIGDRAFSGCASLTGVKLPPSITHIGDGAFSGCKGLTGVKLPPSITSIGYGAFVGCTGLTGVDFAHHKALYIDKGWWQIGCKCHRFEWWTGAEGRAFARANGYTSEEYEAGIKLAREFAATNERAGK